MFNLKHFISCIPTVPTRHLKLKVSHRQDSQIINPSELYRERQKGLLKCKMSNSFYKYTESQILSLLSHC